MSGRRRIDVTATQAVASMLAALTGAVAASRGGIAGTIIGTAFMSLASTVGAATYKFYLARSNERLRKAAENFGTWTGHRTADEATDRAVDTAVDSAVTREQTARAPQTASRATLTPDSFRTEVLPVVRMTPGGVTGRTDPPPSEAAAAGGPPDQPTRWTRRKWIMVAATALGVFVIVMAGITVFEAIAGRPLDAVVWHQKGSGTTIGGLVSGGSGGHHGGGGAPGRSSSPSTSPSSSTSPKPSASPSSSPSSSATSPGPTPTPTPSSATPAPSASPDPGASSGSSVP
jgi:hypothetical protein